MMGLTVGSITQLTEQQRTAWYAPELTEFVVEMGTQPDPRDARIAELERALQWIEQYAQNGNIHPMDRLVTIYAKAQAALVKP